MHIFKRNPLAALAVGRGKPSKKGNPAAIRHKLIAPVAVFLTLSLGCSAADFVSRQRQTPTPEPEIILAPTFTPTTEPDQTLLIITPPTEDRPGVIIVPPGTDPGSVLPSLPTATSASEIVATAIVPPAEVEAVPTESPELAATPTPDQVAIVPTDTATPFPSPTATSTPSPTDTPPPPPPTPFVSVLSGLAALRGGPGIEYPLLSQLGPDIPVAIVGKSDDETWLQICCISGEPVWVAKTHVNVNNDLSGIQVALAGPPPTATPTDTPTITPTVTPTATPTPYPFEKAIGPQFFPSSNEFLTIFSKLFVGVSPDEEPAEGYYLTVKFEGFDRPNSSGKQPSKDTFEYSAPPGSGSRTSYNHKYEYRPPDPKKLDPNSDTTPLQLLGTGTWSVYVSDAEGRQLSDEVTFTTAPSNPNREIYLGWRRVR